MLDSAQDFLTGPARVPIANNLADCRAILAGTFQRLGSAFDWSETPQGVLYWALRSIGDEPITQRDRAFILAVMIKTRRAK